MNLLKVFADKKALDGAGVRARIVESYDAFQLVEADDEASQTLATTFPVEDITGQFALPAKGPATPANAALRARAGKATRDEAQLKPGPHHYIVQFIGPIKPAWLTKVRATGAVLRMPYESFSHIVRATQPQRAAIAALPFVRWVGHLPHAERVGWDVDAGAGELRAAAPGVRERAGVLTVELFDKADIPRIATAARKLGFEVLAKEPGAALLIVESDAAAKARDKQVAELSSVHGVRFIRQRMLARTRNDVATGLMGNAYAATLPAGLKLSGAGEVIAICDTGIDTGNPDDIHADFAGRIVAIKSYPVTSDWKSLVYNAGADDGPADRDSGHGTHVAGSALGNGATSAQGPALIRGHAHGAKLVFQAIEQEMDWRPDAPWDYRKSRYMLSGIPLTLAPLFRFAYAQGARIHSNSWGGGVPGAYDDQCRQFDEFVWKNKDFCFVVAAGNDGTDQDGDGRINQRSVTSPGTAKNCITVGASENLRPGFNSERYGSIDWWKNDFPEEPIASDPMANDPDQVVAFSSRGPTSDKRIKPDVVAPGTFILSTRSSQIAPNNFAWAAYGPNKSKYFYMGGTSMATPLVAGALALIREYLRKKAKVANPSAALLKAMLIAGAQRLPGIDDAAVMDNHQGFGRVNLDRSLTSVLISIDGPGLTTGKKASLSFKVPQPGKTLRIVLCYSDYPGATLVNNLNLIAIDPAGSRVVGNQSTGAGMLALDNTNNTEVIQIAGARAGTWSVDIVASNVSQGKQDFAVAAVLV